MNDFLTLKRYHVLNRNVLIKKKNPAPISIQKMNHIYIASMNVKKDTSGRIRPWAYFAVPSPFI